MPGVSGGGEPPEPVTVNPCQRGLRVYWLYNDVHLREGYQIAIERTAQKKGCYLI